MIMANITQHNQQRDTHLRMAAVQISAIQIYNCNCATGNRSCVIPTH